MTVTEISGFESKSSPVEVLDGKGRPFYYLRNENKKRITFNLPEGEYLFMCEYSKLSRPLRYECPPLPKPEKFIKIVDELDIHIGENPNKASFKNGTGEMFIDEEAIWNTNIPKRRFVMGHELGHNFYFSEWKCDVFSAKTMLEEGYNPSQCFYANAFCLSDKQEKRKEDLFKYLKKVKCYE